MKMGERSFPYPVVGNRDDVPGASFQASIAIKFDSATAFIDVEIELSSRTLLALLATGEAGYIAHLECSNTLFRNAFRFRENKFRISVPTDSLNSTVELNVLIIALSSISNYVVDGQHSDYADARFVVNKGDILAIYPSQQFDIDRDPMSFQNIDSIVSILQQPVEADLPMEVIIDGEKLTILLSKSDFAEYGLVRNSLLAPILASTIVLPVIAEAVRALAERSDELDYRWCRAVRKRLNQLNLTLDGEPLSVAQELLELPIRRALGSAVSAQNSD